MNDQTAQPTYSWFERPLVRILTISTIYLLGVVTVIVIQMQIEPIFARALPLVFFLLPTGWIEGVFLFFPYARLLTGGWRIQQVLSWGGFLLFVALIVVIMRARSRIGLVLGYIGFIIFVLLAVKGCSQRIEMP